MRGADYDEGRGASKYTERDNALFLLNLPNSGEHGRTVIGGRGGIRTHGTLAGTPVFKTGALNHSATLPNQQFQSLSAGPVRTQCERGPNMDPSGHFPRNPAARALMSAEI